MAHGLVPFDEESYFAEMFINRAIELLDCGVSMVSNVETEDSTLTVAVSVWSCFNLRLRIRRKFAL